MPWSKPHRRKDGRFDCGQIGIVKMYAKYAGLSDQDYRQMLFQATGATTSTDPHLDQYDFDVFMPVLEMRTHMAELNGKTVGKKPARIRDWYYWRNRNPLDGDMTTRQRHKLFALRAELIPLMERPPADMLQYMHGMAEHASGEQIPSFWALTKAQAELLIEAVKLRIAQEIRRKDAIAV